MREHLFVSSQIMTKSYYLEQTSFIYYIFSGTLLIITGLVLLMWNRSTMKKTVHLLSPWSLGLHVSVSRASQSSTYYSSKSCIQEMHKNRRSFSFFVCLVFLFVLTGDFILQSSSRFIDKLSRKYREFLQILSPYTRSFLFLLRDAAWNNGEGLNSPVQGCEFKS